MTKPSPMNDRACPICGKAPTEALTSVLPFCSERCRSIDLGRWLSERYRFAADSTQDVEEELDEPIEDRPVDPRRS